MFSNEFLKNLEKYSIKWGLGAVHEKRKHKISQLYILSAFDVNARHAHDCYKSL